MIEILGCDHPGGSEKEMHVDCFIDLKDVGVTPLAGRSSWSRPSTTFVTVGCVSSPVDLGSC